MPPSIASHGAFLGSMNLLEQCMNSGNHLTYCCQCITRSTSRDAHEQPDEEVSKGGVGRDGASRPLPSHRSQHLRVLSGEDTVRTLRPRGFCGKAIPLAWLIIYSLSSQSPLHRKGDGLKTLSSQSFIAGF